MRRRRAGEADTGRRGVGPLIPPLSDSQRPLRQQIFERIRAAGAVSRVRLARDLSISPASVTTLTSELIGAGLVEEISRDSEGARGRPAVALGVRAEACHVAGVKLSDREHTAVLVDFAGNLVADDAAPGAGAPVPTEDLLDTLADLVDRLCARAGLAREKVAGLGLGAPGFIDTVSGVAHWSSALSARDVPLAAAARARLGMPVTIDNDANLVTLAELWFGAGRSLSDFAVVTIEHGVGMGYVMNHRIIRGGRGVGMELGHTKVELDGALCRCGQRGCLEAYVADYALAREAMTALKLPPQARLREGQLLDELFRHAKGGNAAARSIFHRAGRYLAVGLANVINIFDPTLIVLSGGRMRFDYLYAEETLAELEHLAIATGRAPTPVEIHAWGDLLWAHGAAALALSEVSERLLAQPREMAL